MCVIRGWDPLCEAEEAWRVRMGVDTLERKDKQPFYHVLVEDGSYRYAAEDNLLLPVQPSPVTHPEIGRYFESYNAAGYYEMNSEMRASYPDELTPGAGKTIQELVVTN